MLLFLSILLIALGPLVCYFSRKAPFVLKIIDSFIVLSIIALVLLHIIPENIMERGWSVIFVMLFGLLFPLVIEMWIKKATELTHLVLLIVVVIGIGSHAFFDGAALVIYSSASLPLAILLHRLPVGFLIWRLFENHYVYASLAIFGIICTTVIGYVVAKQITLEAHSIFLGYFEAFVAGSILHVVLHKMHRWASHNH